MPPRMSDRSYPPPSYVFQLPDRAEVMVGGKMGRVLAKWKLHLKQNRVHASKRFQIVYNIGGRAG